jgi:transcriptional regulator with XRE-family HTH domain
MNTPAQSTDDEIVNWLEDGARQTGIHQAELARQAGLSKSTVSRLMTRGRSGKHPVTLEQMIALSRVLRKPLPPRFQAMAGEPAGFAEPELRRLLDDVSAADPNISRWEIRGDSIALAGYLPGDEIWFDARVKPERGDIVLANIYKRAGAETVMRLWMPPFLVAAEPGIPSIAPVEVKDEDDPKAVILGTMIDLHRKRRPHAA